MVLDVSIPDPCCLSYFNYTILSAVYAANHVTSYLVEANDVDDAPAP